MLVGLFAGFVAICLMLLVLHLLQFIGLRIRNEAAAERDPQLGRKFVLHLFQHFAILLALAGFTISAIDVTDSVLIPFGNKNAGPGGFGGGGRGGIFFDEDDEEFQVTTQATVRWDQQGGFAPPPAKAKPAKNWWNSAQRFAVALILSGILQGSMVFTVLLVGTNNRSFPGVGRAFGVTRLVIAGIILLGCTTIVIISILQKGATDYKGLSMIIGIGLIWGPTALAHLIWMRMAMTPEKKRISISAGRERDGPGEVDDEEPEPKWRRKEREDEEPAPRQARRITKSKPPADEPRSRRNDITGEVE